MSIFSTAEATTAPANTAGTYFVSPIGTAGLQVKIRKPGDRNEPPIATRHDLSISPTRPTGRPQPGFSASAQDAADAVGRRGAARRARPTPLGAGAFPPGRMLHARKYYPPG